MKMMAFLVAIWVVSLGGCGSTTTRTIIIERVPEKVEPKKSRATLEKEKINRGKCRQVVFVFESYGVRELRGDSFRMQTVLDSLWGSFSFIKEAIRVQRSSNKFRFGTKYYNFAKAITYPAIAGYDSVTVRARGSFCEKKQKRVTTRPFLWVFSLKTTIVDTIVVPLYKRGLVVNDGRELLLSYHNQDTTVQVSWADWYGDDELAIYNLQFFVGGAKKKNKIAGITDHKAGGWHFSASPQGGYAKKGWDIFDARWDPWHRNFVKKMHASFQTILAVRSAEAVERK